MSPIRTILARRDRAREAEAATLATAAIGALRSAGFDAWLIGSLARGDFRSHSDIDILIDATGPARDQAIAIFLRATKDFPSSIVFRTDVPAHILPFLLQEAADGPRLRGH